jgi:hypothetical protein
VVGAGEVFFAGEREGIGAGEQGAALAAGLGVQAGGGPAGEAQGGVNEGELGGREFGGEGATSRRAAEEPFAGGPVEGGEAAGGEDGADDVAGGLAVGEGASLNREQTSMRSAETIWRPARIQRSR